MVLERNSLIKLSTLDELLNDKYLIKEGDNYCITYPYYQLSSTELNNLGKIIKIKDITDRGFSDELYFVDSDDHYFSVMLVDPNFLIKNYNDKVSVDLSKLYNLFLEFNNVMRSNFNIQVPPVGFYLSYVLLYNSYDFRFYDTIEIGDASCDFYINVVINKYGFESFDIRLYNFCDNGLSISNLNYVLNEFKIFENTLTCFIKKNSSVEFNDTEMFI